jgi:hypothetical protein
VTLVAAPAQAITNQTVALFASVRTSTGSPSGTVTFMNFGAPIGGCVAEPVTPSSTTATCQTSLAASRSPDQPTAVFTPSAGSNVLGSSGGTAVTIARDSTSTTLDASSKVIVGTSTTYTAAVAPPAIRPGPVQPSGSVTFLDNGQPISSCANQPLAGGGATCTVGYGATGGHNISARYNGDANFNGSDAAAQTVTVIKPSQSVLGVITSTMQWTFSFTPNYTKVDALVINGATPGGSVLINCRGRGCPFAKHTTRVSSTRPCGRNGKKRCSTHGVVSLTSAFKNRRLHIGSRLRIELVRPGWIGKYYMFKVRSRQAPQVQISCLAPGGTRPGVGC